jgi:RNA polymerase sigma-70 factor (ECF subfamily)
MLSRTDFDHLVRAYAAELFRFAYWQCRDRNLAEDLVQETFTRAWKGRGQLQDLAAVKPWLYRILRNEHARLYERKTLPMAEGEFSEWPLADGMDVERDYAVREQVAQLPAQYREPLLMQVLGGLTCAEIGDSLGLSEPAAMQRLTRARLALRRLWLGEATPERKDKST